MVPRVDPSREMGAEWSTPGAFFVTIVLVVVLVLGVKKEKHQTPNIQPGPIRPAEAPHLAFGVWCGVYRARFISIALSCSANHYRQRGH